MLEIHSVLESTLASVFFRVLGTLSTVPLFVPKSYYISPTVIVRKHPPFLIFAVLLVGL